MSYAEDQKKIRQYLLGNLSDELRQPIEERLLTESSFYDELVLSEEELIDDYVNGELADDERLKFEQHFLSAPERQQQLRFAQALSRYTANLAETVEADAAKTPSSVTPTKLSWAARFHAFWSGQTSGLRAAVALLVIAILVGALWLSSRRTSPQTFATLTLSASVSNNRAEGVQAAKVSFPLKDDALKIFLKLPEQSSPAASYKVELVDNNRETKTLKVAGQDAQSVQVVIPASELARGQYALKLFMIKADGTQQRVSGNYFFTVE
jgi:methionine-rich copper-binding protein CopC